MKPGKALSAMLFAVLLAGEAPAEAPQPVVMARFVKARLLAITFGKDQSLPILSYQFEGLQEYGYLEPERQAFACPITTSTYQVGFFRDFRGKNHWSERRPDSARRLGKGMKTHRKAFGQ